MLGVLGWRWGYCFRYGVRKGLAEMLKCWSQQGSAGREPASSADGWRKHHLCKDTTLLEARFPLTCSLVSQKYGLLVILPKHILNYCLTSGLDFLIDNIPPSGWIWSTQTYRFSILKEPHKNGHGILTSVSQPTSEVGKLNTWQTDVIYFFGMGPILFF